jgi:hypothetical protein
MRNKHDSIPEAWWAFLTLSTHIGTILICQQVEILNLLKERLSKTLNIPIYLRTIN